MKNNIIPIDALFGDGMSPNLASDPRRCLRDAEIVFGVDWMTEHEFIVYGRESLKEIARAGEPKALAVLRIGLDQETDELEKLIALIRAVKGKDDYQPG